VSVALGIQHAERMRRFILSSVGCLALLYFSTFSHKQHDYRENVPERKMYLDFLYSFFSDTFLILRKTARVMVKMYIGLHGQYPWLSDFNETWQTDGRTDGRAYMTKIVVAFRSFANAPKNRSYFTEDTTWTHYKDNRLMLLRNISEFYCKNRTKHRKIHVPPKTQCFAHNSL